MPAPLVISAFASVNYAAGCGKLAPKMAKTRGTQQRTPEVCPVCGEDVPPRALACPECGADHNSGWREDTAAYDGVDLGEEEFNYDEFVREEFGGAARPRGISALWWITAIVLIAALAALWIFAG